MFYSIPKDKLEKFNAALLAIGECYANLAPVYCGDMLITIAKNHSFLANQAFMRAFKATAETRQEDSLQWRLHTLAWAAEHALHVPGDFVECGVLRGFSSAVLCNYLQFANIPKQFYLYDTFSGLPKETSTEAERQLWSAYAEKPSAEQLEEVRRRFAAYPNVRIIQGIVPTSFAQAA